ncbi:MAG: ArsR/SmtB family transcription factor [Actinomycetota bacterium]
MTTYQASLSALADPTRRRLVERLSKRPLAVGELARGLPISRPAVSQHLRVLEEARLVRARPAGNRRIYELEREGFEKLRAYVESFWDTALEEFAAEARRRVRRSKR